MNDTCQWGQVYKGEPNEWLGDLFALLLDERENAQEIFVCCVSLVGVSNEVGRPQATPFASVYFPLRPSGSGVREEGEYSRYGRVVNRDVSLVVRGLRLEIGKDTSRKLNHAWIDRRIGFFACIYSYICYAFILLVKWGLWLQPLIFIIWI